MGKPGELSVEGLLLTPGAGGTSDHPTLIAIQDALSPFTVIRHDFAYRRAGNKAPPRAPKLVAELAEELPEIAAKAGVSADRLVLGGRSMGGRVCSMAVAAGLPAAGLVLLSYPLHPPGKPDNLRADHFPDLDLPVLFVNGDSDPFGTPDELESHIDKIPGPVTTVWIEGGNHDPKHKDRVPAVVEAVATWLGDLQARRVRA
ncbi:MAG: putative alpha/beta-hydrolase family hydrolase [Candidatus Poriferisodalaceae bacterium]|jgi:predicted alpha/beta-hydrolase family hydrolase